MYSVCGDESHDEKKQRAFAIGGLFGSQDDWDATAAAWIARTGGQIFHAADCESDRGDFAAVDHQENLRLYKDLAQIIINSKLCARGVGIDLAGSREYFPDNPPESPYHKCLLEILIQFGELAYLSIPQQKVKFTFDHRFETDYSATQLYQYATDQPDWKLFACYHDKIAFATNRSPGIQMADLIARETMKELDRRVGPAQRDMRKSMAVMVSRPYRFGFTYFMREYFKDFKRQFPDVQAAAGLEVEAYAAWLQKMGLSDNWSSRIRYVTYLEANERLANKEKTS